jgi:hypothetical protein
VIESGEGGVSWNTVSLAITGTKGVYDGRDHD